MYNKEIVIGYIRKSHGLKGVVNVQMYYPYSHELLLKNKNIVLDGVKYEIEDVFGVVEMKMKVKLKNINDIDEAKKLCGSLIIVNSLNETFYPAELIGFNTNKKGRITDVFNFNAGDIIEINNEQMISINEIKSIDSTSNTVYLK